MTHEADQRHAESMIVEIYMKEATSEPTPGAREDSEKAGSDDGGVSGEEATKYRRLVARPNRLAADRPITRFAAKEICPRVSSP